MELYIFELVKYQISTETDNVRFLDKIYPKRVFLVENRTSSPRTTSVYFFRSRLKFNCYFEHFEDLKNLIILNILKEKLVISCLLGPLS